MLEFIQTKPFNKNMDNTELKNLTNSLNLSIKKNSANLFIRVLRHPIKMLWSKLLEKNCLSKNQTKQMKATLFWGEDMNVVLPEIVSCFLHRYGFFEPDLTKIFLMHLKPGQTFFDVGTHFGYYSMLASKLVGHEGQVHGFEPTPGTYKILHSNLSKKK